MQAPEISTLRCCVISSYLNGVVSFQDSCAGKLFIDAALHMSQISLVEKLLSNPVHYETALIKSWVPKAARNRQFRCFNACSEMSTCHYNVVLDVCPGCGELQLMDQVLDPTLKTGVADIKKNNTVLKGYARFISVKNMWNVVDTFQAAGFRPIRLFYFVPCQSNTVFEVNGCFFFFFLKIGIAESSLRA